MSKNYFRLIVISSLVLATLSGLYDLFWPDPITEKISNYAYELEPEIESENLIFFGAFAILAFILAMASVIGLLLFKNWGRHLYLVGFIIFIPIYPFMGVMVNSGISQIFYDLSMITSGVILALIYFSPVSQYFHKN